MRACFPVCGHASPTLRSCVPSLMYTAPSDYSCPFRYKQRSWIAFRMLLMLKVRPWEMCHLLFYTVQMKDARVLNPEWQAHVEAFLHIFTLANAGVWKALFIHLQPCTRNNRTFCHSFAEMWLFKTIILNRLKPTSNSNTTRRLFNKNSGITATTVLNDVIFFVINAKWSHN